MDNYGGIHMEWKKIFDERKMTSEEAVKFIKSGDRVFTGHACGEPAHIVEAMVKNAKEYKNVEIIHLVAMGKAEYCLPEYAENFHHNAIFVGSSTRKASRENLIDFTPSFFHEVPKLIKTVLKPDVALVMVTPPNAEGYCSLGVSVDYTLEAIKQSKTVIAQVNVQMPWTGSGSLVHVSELDCIVEYDEPIIELQPPTITDIEKAIGENCAKLINDGDTIQLGIGAIPDAVLLFLKEKKDLGIHSEMISDGVLELVEAGVITNSKKTIHNGKSILTFIMGTRKLYDYIDNNPDIEFRPVDYVNNPFVISQNDNMKAINSCVQVDFMGQVVSETIGTVQISGVGGQVDFVRGATASNGGAAIMAMPSTVKGKISKIVPFLDHGAAVTTSRNDVDYIVTEYGIAPMKGVSLRQRAKNLINIAHPKFREELIAQYEERFCSKFDE